MGRKPKPEAAVLYENPATLAKAFEHLAYFESVGLDLSDPAKAEAASRARLADLHGRLTKLVSRHSPADLVEAVRASQSPVSLEGYKETEHLGLMLTVEVAALAISSQGYLDEAVTTEVVAEVSELGQKIAHEIRILRFVWLAQAPQHALSQLGYEIAEQALVVRSMQFRHLRRPTLAALFERKETRAQLYAKLGWGWAELEAVFAAVIERLENAMTQSFRDIRGDWRLDADGELPVEVMSRFTAHFQRPGEIASFRVSDICPLVDSDESAVRAMLDFLSVEADPRPSSDTLIALASGKNPFSGRPLLKLSDDRYVLVSEPQFLDGVRDALERELKPDSKLWNSYERGRAKHAEVEAARLLEILLSTPAALSNFRYLAPGPGQSIEHFSREHPSAGNDGVIVEGDHLFEIGDVAIGVEVKAGGVTPRARAGYVDRLASDLEKTLGDAERQARRLRDLILKNNGVWLEDGTWHDLSSVQAAHNIVVSLDDLGSAGIAMDELAHAGLIPEGEYPWVVSLHDLAVIAEMIERPAEFYLYLRRRTSPEVATMFKTSDELDLVMLFLRGQLYALPSPELLQEQDPSGKRPKAQYVQDYAAQSRVIVQSQTDDLDAWMLHEHGETETGPEKPKLRPNRRLSALVDWLADGKKPGWLRAGADLLDGSSDTQDGIERNLNEIVSRSRSDGQSHSLAHGVNGQWGYVLFTAATRGNDETAEEAVRRLSAYSELKRHQTKASRCLSLLLGPGPDGTVEYEAVGYLSAPIRSDALRDRLAAEHLFPLEDRRPPSAKRNTRRLRGGKKHR